MKIGIVGLGLIGGSLGLDFRTANHQVYGMSRSAQTCQIAVQMGAADTAETDAQILSEVDVVFLCTPIGLLSPVLENIKPHLAADTIVTDVGSVKGDLVHTLEQQWSLFIGGHPMAGTSESGIKAAQSNLFQNRPYVLTPTHSSSEQAQQVMQGLIADLKSNLCIASPKHHDRAVSLISHLPILISANLIKTCGDIQNQDVISLAQSLASSGFCDTSRVGGGNPELGRMVAEYNREELLRSIHLYEENLQELKQIVEASNWELLEQKLKKTHIERPGFL